MNKYIDSTNTVDYDLQGLMTLYSDINNPNSTKSVAFEVFLKRSAVKFAIVGSSLLANVEQTYSMSPILKYSDELSIDSYNNEILNDYPNCLQDYKTPLSLKKMKSELIQDIVSFESLKVNWDGYSAVPLEVKTASNAINFINLLDDKTISGINSLFPNPNGTLSIIWTNIRNERISFEIGNKSYSFYSKFNSSKPNFFEGKYFDAKLAKQITELVSWL